MNHEHNIYLQVHKFSGQTTLAILPHTQAENKIRKNFISDTAITASTSQIEKRIIKIAVDQRVNIMLTSVMTIP